MDYLGELNNAGLLDYVLSLSLHFTAKFGLEVHSSTPLQVRAGFVTPARSEASQTWTGPDRARGTRTSTEATRAPAGMSLQTKCSQPIQSAFYKAFYNWGSFVGKRPCLVIFASTVLCVLGAIRLPLAFVTPLESVVEQDQLWVPQEAQAITDKNKYDAAFSTTYRRNVLLPVEGALWCCH